MNDAETSSSPSLMGKVSSDHSSHSTNSSHPPTSVQISAGGGLTRTCINQPSISGLYWEANSRWRSGESSSFLFFDSTVKKRYTLLLFWIDGIKPRVELEANPTPGKCHLSRRLAIQALSGGGGRGFWPRRQQRCSEDRDLVSRHTDTQYNPRPADAKQAKKGIDYLCGIG
jgi:hypothetical protein